MKESEVFEGSSETGSSRKVWIGIVVVIVVVVGVVFLIMSLSSSSKEREFQIGILKYMKCETFCPFEDRDDMSGNPNIVEECRQECIDKFYPSGGVPSEKSREIKRLFSECYSTFIGEWDKAKYKNCLNEGVEEYSDVVDLSDFSPDLNFVAIDLDILNLTCSGNSAHVVLNISGGSVEGVAFVVSEEGSTATVFDFQNQSYGEGVHEFDFVSRIEYVQNIEEVWASYYLNGKMSDMHGRIAC